MSILELLLGLRCVLGQAVKCCLEVSLGVFTVLLCSVSLLFEEFELAFPESLVSIVSIVEVLVLAVELGELLLLPLDLLLDQSLVSVQRLHQLLIRLLQPSYLCFRDLVCFLELILESGALLGEDGSLSFHGGGHSGQVSLDVFQGLALLIVLNFDCLLLSSDAGDFVLRVTDELLSLVSQALFVTLDGIIELPGQLSDALFLELQLLTL